PSSEVALMTKILSPQMTGCEWLLPGSSIRQRKSFSVQATGMDFESLSPVPLGPRKRVHSCASAADRRANDAKRVREGFIILRYAGFAAPDARKYQDRPEAVKFGGPRTDLLSSGHDDEVGPAHFFPGPGLPPPLRGSDGGRGGPRRALP